MAHNHDIDVLSSLITTTIDSADGFERAAEDCPGSHLQQMFRDFAAERRRVVADLQATVRGLGGDPPNDGSLTADLHRRWVDLRAAITSGDAEGEQDRVVVQEVERGEDWLKSKYDAALDDIALSPVALAAIREAYKSIRNGHDMASALKHSLEGAVACGRSGPLDPSRTKRPPHDKSRGGQVQGGAPASLRKGARRAVAKGEIRRRQGKDGKSFPGFNRFAGIWAALALGSES